MDKITEITDKINKKILKKVIELTKKVKISSM